MSLVIRVEPAESLAAYASVPIAFTVASVLDVEPADAEPGGISLRECALDAPYVKDYDALESPLEWARRFDLSYWTFLAAYDDGERVGGAAVVIGAPDVEMVGSANHAVLWDVRVRPEHRGRGVGASLFRAAAGAARAAGCGRMVVETQNTNVAACRFYARQGCTLASVRRFVYPALPHEVQLIWHLDLSGGHF